MSRTNPNPDHIPLKYLKGLIPKLLYLDAESEPYPSIREDFIDFLDSVCDVNVKRSPPEERLDDSFRSRVLPSLNEFQGTEAFKIFNDALQRVNCSLCASERQPLSGNMRLPCCGNIDEDPVVVADPGHCIAALHTLFYVSSEFARRTYQRYAPDAKNYGLYFNTQHTMDDPLHDIPIGYNVDGRTTFTEEYSTITLILNARIFNAEALRAILYVMFHECICHAFQGSVDSENSRAGCGPDDLFGEGWMDYVAAELLHQFLSREISSFPDLLDMVPRAKEMAEVGRIFHYQRKNLIHPNPA